jgi:hypothetical protein
MTVIDTAGYVSEFTQRTLEQFGWIKGDPILDTTGELIQQIKERTPATKKPGLIIDMELMSEQDINVMRAALAAAKQEKVKEEQAKKLKAHVAGLAPGVQEAYQRIDAISAKSSGENNSVEIVDDRTATADTPQDAPAEIQSQKTVPDAVPTKEKPDVSAAAGVVPPVDLTKQCPAFCPRCDWDMRQDYEVKINDIDKENFLATILGGTRFKKEYKILNGRYQIVFRSLLADENKRIHRQLVNDKNNNEFFSDTEWFLKFFEYRLACSIDTIVVDKTPTAVVPTLEELGVEKLPTKTDDPALPPLIRLHNYVVKELLGAEITRRLVGKHFREFQRLYEALEAMALEPNFW